MHGYMATWLHGYVDAIVTTSSGAMDATNQIVSDHTF